MTVIFIFIPTSNQTRAMHPTVTRGNDTMRLYSHYYDYYLIFLFIMMITTIITLPFF